MKKKELDKAKSLIINILNDKVLIKNKTFQSVESAFKLFKETANDIVNDYNKAIKEGKNKELHFKFIDKSNSEFEIRYSTETLIFNLQPNIFEFEKSHSVWTNSYVQDKPLNAFTGIINIYNFLSDSIEFNKSEDLGYLIARIFVNHEIHYFVEGKRQLGFLYNDYANSTLKKQDVKNIIESAILYSLDFELLVPNYDDISIISVEQIKDKMSKTKSQTGKRLGFQFYPDDDNI